MVFGVQVPARWDFVLDPETAAQIIAEQGIPDPHWDPALAEGGSCLHRFYQATRAGRPHLLAPDVPVDNWCFLRRQERRRHQDGARLQEE